MPKVVWLSEVLKKSKSIRKAGGPRIERPHGQGRPAGAFTAAPGQGKAGRGGSLSAATLPEAHRA